MSTVIEQIRDLLTIKRLLLEVKISKDLSDDIERHCDLTLRALIPERKKDGQ